jgi:hypothetical protein
MNIVRKVIGKCREGEGEILFFFVPRIRHVVSFRTARFIFETFKSTLCTV